MLYYPHRSPTKGAKRAMLLYIIRHGDPIYETDTLTEKGKRQAEAVGRRLASRRFDRVYASANKRAQETAKPFCELTGLPLQIAPWTSESLAWRDLSVETDEGRTWAFTSVPNTAFRREESLRAGDDWHRLPEFAAIDGPAAYGRIIAASDEFLARQGYVREGRVYRAVRPNDERVAVFCHQGFGLTWLSHLLQIPPQMFWASFDITHTGVTILQFKADKNGFAAPRCLCFSDMSHLYAERLPMVYVNDFEV